MKRRSSNKLIKGEKGQVLLIALIVMLFGSLILPPLLSHMRTGLWVGKEVFEERMYLSYAADSGVEDALWQVKNKQLLNLFPTYEQYGYYDYSYSYEWKYELEEEYGAVGIVNDKDVEITFQNVWMPKGISAPSLSEAESIANEGRLVVYGSMSGASATEYEIKMLYYYNNTNPAQPDYDPEGANLLVQSIGIWLPPGFEYNNSLAGAPVTPSVEDEPYKSGRAVVWNFPASPNYPTLKSFPLGTSSINPLVRTITFEFTGPEGRTPGTALAWMKSTGVSGISYSWDSSVKVYKISSKSSDDTDNEVTVEAYAAMTDMLKRGAAICGDYCALGGTLMTVTTDSYFRDRLFKDSFAVVQDTNPAAPFYVPPDAHLDLAYLYWSGWLENAGIWGDDCDDLSNWNYSSSNWTVPWGTEYFRGHYSSGSRELSMKNGVDLTPYVGQTVSVSWTQSGGRNYSGGGNTLELSDGLDYAFSGDGGITWSTLTEAFRNDLAPTIKTVPIPSQYLTEQFKLKFSIADCSGSNEYVFIDNVAISLGGSPVENARVSQIMFNGVKVTANPTNIQTQQSGATGAPNSLSYSCFYDATSLVLGMIGGGLGANGTGTYTVGHVLDWPGDYQLYNYPEGTPSAYTTAYPLGTPAKRIGDPPDFPDKYQWSYAAWSLIIVYSSPDTQGHQLYLYPDLRYCDSSIGSLSFSIGGFIAPEAIKDEDHAAHLTCFVGEGDDNYGGDYIMVNSLKLWDGTTTGGNSQGSPNDVWNETSRGLDESGIDIDTFTVAYPTVKPGDISAQVLIDTSMDAWNLVYIILSFRSEIVPASTVSYLLR